MIRKGIPLIAIVFVLAATCIVTAAAPIPESWSRNMNAAELGITKFNQAPELDEKVKRGELPPVEERLPHPEDILVIEPVEGIGKYGGEAVSNAVGPNTWSDSDHARLPFLFFTDQNASVVLGDVAKDYKLENTDAAILQPWWAFLEQRCKKRFQICSRRNVSAVSLHYPVACSVCVYAHLAL